ncbi:MAG TPA: alpha/beta fold hydrolase [Nitrolancea sp.]|jgi:pimeloyl-ACP methyl ester carboxylesterase|nr:alpha/beta fold hydrolase [Nitrolancea sp.]
MQSERRRDNQQWMLDWIVKQTGRVQNFGNDERDVPPEVKSYRMIPRVLHKQARHFESIAREAEQRGHLDTARQLYWKATEVYCHAQHNIFQDDNQEKIFLHQKMMECYEKVVHLADAAVELVEIPWDGVSIQARFHPLADSQRAPTVLFLPGMDMTKELFPNPLSNPYRRRGMNVLTIDGPGQGMSNIRKIRVSHDNYERAASAAIDYLLTRSEVDPERIAIAGTSFGSHWGTRAAALDSRVKVLASTHAVYGSKRAIFEEASPRFKQMFMYMAGIHDEAEFDAMAERMDTAGAGARINCPTLMITGEYDPLCHLEDVVDLFSELAGPKELWVFENEFHRVTGKEGIAGLDIHQFMADWVKDGLDGKLPSDLNIVRLIPQKSGAGPYSPHVESLYLPERPEYL